MIIEISEETKDTIQECAGKTIEDFLEQTRSDILKQYRDEKRISIAEAAEMMGTSRQYIRIGLQRGQLPFGTAVKLSSTWTYYISPQKFYDYLGYKFSDS